MRFLKPLGVISHVSKINLTSTGAGFRFAHALVRLKERDHVLRQNVLTHVGIEIYDLFGLPHRDSHTLNGTTGVYHPLLITLYIGTITHKPISLNRSTTCTKLFITRTSHALGLVFICAC